MTHQKTVTGYGWSGPKTTKAWEKEYIWLQEWDGEHIKTGQKIKVKELKTDILWREADEIN